jgi:hypothetical protein
MTDTPTPPPPNFRALCAELVAAIHRHVVLTVDASGFYPVVDRARAALNQPEPLNPWKEALIDALVVDYILDEKNSEDPKQAIHDLISWNIRLARDPLVAAQPEPVGPTLDDVVELCAEHEFMLGVDGANEEESAKGLLEIARAVLARWGRPAALPAPIPRSEEI